MADPKLTDKTHEDVMSIHELWENLESFAHGRVKDNNLCSPYYPIETRKIQMEILNCLVSAIEGFHKKFST